MKGLMICILATAWVVGVIYAMDSHRRGARHFLRGSLSLHDAVEEARPQFGVLLDRLERAIETNDPKALGWARMVRERIGES